jgi:hypothetical protein
MLDTGKTIEMHGPFRLGDQRLTVRWPSDQEWFNRARRKRLIKRSLGRGQSETQMPEPGEPDLGLYEAITTNGSPQLTAAEANGVLDALSLCNVIGVTIEDQGGVVQMVTAFGNVVHKLNIPTADQIIKWRRSAYRVLDLPHGQQQFIVNPEPGAQLWDSCQGSSQDYAGATPGIHKDTAMQALITFIEQNVGPRQDEGF